MAEVINLVLRGHPDAYRVIRDLIDSGRLTSVLGLEILSAGQIPDGAAGQNGSRPRATNSLPLTYIAFEESSSALAAQLENHLACLIRRAAVWHPGHLNAGDDREQIVSQRLSAASVILIMVTAELFSSQFGKIQLERAIEEHRARGAVIVPVIVKHVEWRLTELGRFIPSPLGGKPVATFPDPEEAFRQITQSLAKNLDGLDQRAHRKSGGMSDGTVA